MADWMLAYADDYSDLGFDVKRHKEAFRRFAESSIDPRSVRAILTAREMLVFEHPTALFYVGSAASLVEDRGTDAEGRDFLVIPLHYAKSHGVLTVRDDVTRYLKRHFPGRCLDQLKSSAIVEGDGCVYIVLFTPP